MNKMNSEANTPTEEGQRQNTAPEDSVIIYRSWFECLIEQGPKKFAIAFIALFRYAFFGILPSTQGLPKPLEAIVNTFIPLIDSNRKKRKNGAKGAPYGQRGGRPPMNPIGVTRGNPTQETTTTPNDIGTGTASGTGTETECVTVSEAAEAKPTADAHPAPAAHTDVLFYLKVFFFRNLQHPEAQAKKFVAHYQSTGWTLAGGESVATDERRLALAERWEVRDDSIGRFQPLDLAMWRALYSIAPQDIQPLMLDRKVSICQTGRAIITCPCPVYEWIGRAREKTEPIIRKWAAGLELRLVPYEI